MRSSIFRIHRSVPQVLADWVGPQPWVADSTRACASVKRFCVRKLVTIVLEQNPRFLGLAYARIKPKAGPKLDRLGLR